MGTDTLGRAVQLQMVLLAAGAGLVVVGGLLLLVGTGSFYPAVGASAGVAPALVAAGVAAVLAAGSRRPRRLAGAIDRSFPRLYPFAPFSVQVGIYILLVVGAVSVFHGGFDVLTGAHNGGQAAGIGDQGDLDALLISGSVVVWGLTVYTVLVVRDVIRLGRRVDAERGLDPYGRPPGPIPEAPAAARRRRPSGPPIAGSGAVLYAVTSIAALAASAGLQILEVDISPAPALDWLVAQPFLPIFILIVGFGVRAMDRMVRDLERASSPLGSGPEEARAGASTPTAPGFVP